MKNAFHGLENAIMVSVSPWVGNQAKQSPIVNKLPQEVVLNGVNTRVFHYQESADLRKKYGIAEDTRIIFHPTAHFSASESDIKGGRYIISLAERFSNQNVLFFVAGRHPTDLTVPNNMRLLGMIKDQQVLADYYAMADIAVVAGKQETFNMPVAESLCCGTPIAGFYAGGPESIALPDYSKFCEHGNVDLLYESVQQLLAADFDKNAISETAKQHYAAEIMAEGYLKIYNKLLKKEISP